MISVNQVRSAFLDFFAKNGHEVVAFRLHLPSKINFHNSGTDVRRGNILVWEQPLAERLRGAPVELEAHMATQSILFRTLWLFGLTFIVVAVSFGLVIWWAFQDAGVPGFVLLAMYSFMSPSWITAPAGTTVFTLNRTRVRYRLVPLAPALR